MQCNAPLLVVQCDSTILRMIVMPILRFVQFSEHIDTRYCELYLEICRGCGVHIIIIDGDSCNNFEALYLHPMFTFLSGEFFIFNLGHCCSKLYSAMFLALVANDTEYGSPLFDQYCVEEYLPFIVQVLANLFLFLLFENHVVLSLLAEYY